MRALAIAASCLCLLSCGGSDAEVRRETLPFPAAQDTWSNGTPGTLTVGSEVNGVRTTTVPAVEVDMTLRFAKPLECEPNLSVTTQIEGIGVVATMWTEVGATEAHAKMRFPRGRAGAASLNLTWVNGNCAPIEIAMDKSTVTFAGAAR